MCLKWRLNVSHLDRRTRSNTTKYVSLIFILMLLLHGVVVVAVAIWLEVANAQTCAFSRKYLVPVHLLLSAGLLAFITCKVCVIHSCYIKTGGLVRWFFLFLAFILILEMTSFIWASVYKSRVNHKRFEKEVRKSSSEISDSMVECWTHMQDKYKCCGVKHFSEWSVSNVTSSGIQDIIDSCICDTSDADLCTSSNGTTFFSNGCSGSLRGSLSVVFTAVQATASVCVLTQTIAYTALYYILSKLNRSAVIDVYKQKPLEVRMSSLSHVSQTWMDYTRTVESRYLEFGYFEFCEIRSVYLNQKYVLISFSSHNLALGTFFFQVQITRSAN